jgi:hypothetical protein
LEAGVRLESREAGALRSASGLFVLAGEMDKTNGKISPQELLEAALNKAMASVVEEKTLSKATADGIVQLLRLYKEYGGDEEGIPKKLRVIWLDEMKANDRDE